VNANFHTGTAKKKKKKKRKRKRKKGKLHIACSNEVDDSIMQGQEVGVSTMTMGVIKK
jgi:hypothetical protein